MTIFSPCFAGLYAHPGRVPITETEREKLNGRLARLMGSVQPVTFNLRRIYAVLVGESVSVAHSSNNGTGVNGNAFLIGDLHNRSEVRTEIKFGHYCADDASDADLVLAAYQLWGPECVEKLIGDYIAVMFNERKGLCCAIDPSGEHPLFFTNDDCLFRWATHPGLLVNSRHLQYDQEYFTEFLYGRACQRTPFTGITRLRPGHAVISDEGVVREYRWWQPPLRGSIHYSDKQDYIEHLRKLLMEATRCRLEGHERACILLSGGIDSGAVAVCSSELIRHGVTETSELIALTMSAPHHPRSDESPYAAETARRLGIPHRRVPEPMFPRMDEIECLANAMPTPTGHIFLAPSHAELARAAANHGATVALTGAGGEAFLSDTMSFIGLLAEGRYLRFLIEVGRLHLRGIPIASIAKRIMLCLREFACGATFVTPRRNSNMPWVRKVPTKAPVTDASMDAVTRELEALIIQLNRIDILDMAVYRPTGVQAKSPFLDRRVLEFAFAIPIEINIPKQAGEPPKAMLRDAFPEVSRETSRRAARVDLGYFTSARWGTGTQLRELEYAVQELDPVFDEVIDRSLLLDNIASLRQPGRFNDVAGSLAIAIWVRSQHLLGKNFGVAVK